MAEELKANPDRHFRMDELPFHGRHPMMLFIEKVGFFESVPMVQHSGCLVAFSDQSRVDDDQERLLQRMSSCSTRSFGSLRDSVTRGGVPCQFYTDTRGSPSACTQYLSGWIVMQRCTDLSVYASSSVRFVMVRREWYKRDVWCRARHKPGGRGARNDEAVARIRERYHPDIVDPLVIPSNFRLVPMFPSKARTLETV